MYADLSNYIPKHSMDFSAWQEYKQEDTVNKEEATSQQTQLTEEVMVRGSQLDWLIARFGSPWCWQP